MYQPSKSQSCQVSGDGDASKSLFRSAKMPPSSYVPPDKRQKLQDSLQEVERRQRKEDPTWSMFSLFIVNLLYNHRAY